jgi:hypothetical protein
VREQRIGLEHHGNLALRRCQLRHILAVDMNAAAAGFVQPGDQAQGGGLAAAGRPQQDREVARLHLEIDVLDCLGLAPVFADAAQEIAAMCCSW